MVIIPMAAGQALTANPGPTWAPACAFHFLSGRLPWAGENAHCGRIPWRACSEETLHTGKVSQRSRIALQHGFMVL